MEGEKVIVCCSLIVMVNDSVLFEKKTNFHSLNALLLSLLLPLKWMSSDRRQRSSTIGPLEWNNQ